jgi:hypothetical protein
MADLACRRRVVLASGQIKKQWSPSKWRHCRKCSTRSNKCPPTGRSRWPSLPGPLRRALGGSEPLGSDRYGTHSPRFCPTFLGHRRRGSSVLPDDRRLALAAIRALRLLLMALIEAYGFKIKVAFNLAKAGLATGHTGRVPTGGRAVEVFGVQITDGGRALAEWRG